MENADEIQRRQYEEHKLKVIQYSIGLNSYKLPLVVVVALVLMQSIQLISMAVVTPITFDSFGLSWFRKVAQVMYPEYYLRSTRLVMYIVPTCFLCSTFHAFLLIYTFKKQSRLKIVVHYLFIIFNTITVVPFALTNISTLVCIDGNPFSHNFQCFSGIHILYFILGLLNMGWLLLCILFVLLFYVNPSPFSYEYFTCSSNLWMAGKILIKFAPVIFLVVDPSLQFDVLYIVSFAGINLINFIAFKVMWPYSINHRFVQNLIVRCDFLVIIVTVFFIPLRFLFSDDANNPAFVVSWLLGLIFGQFTIEIFALKKRKLLDIFNQTEQAQEGSEKYQQFFYDLIYKLEHRELQKPQLICLLKLHQKTCKDSQCPCTSIAKAYLRQQDCFLLDETIYTFISVLIDEISSKIKSKINLKLISGFISYYKLNKKIKAIHLLSELLNNNKISLREEISIRMLHFKLKNQDNSVTFLNKYRQFSQYQWEFQRKAEIAINNCRKYWIELIQQDCEVSKIWRMANIVHKDKIYLDYIVNEKLLKIFPNNLHTLRLYSQLLSSVFRVPYQQMEKYLYAFQIAFSLSQQLEQNKEKILFRENQEMSVMCAAEIDGIFQFIRVNSNIIQIFQMRSVDFLHKNINLIIPQIYQQFHDKKIKQYLFQNDNNIKQRNGKVFVIDANQNFVQCVYKVKILFSQKYGLEFVCFIRKINTDGPKKKFMSYVIDQSTKDNVKHYKRGDVIHIDPELKQFFCGEEIEQYNENYHGRIQDLLPEWSIDQEKIIFSDENQNGLHLFSKIELTQTDQLQQGVFMKYLAFTYRIQVPRLTIEPIRQTSSATRRQSNLRQSFWSETSHSRLNLLDYTEKTQQHNNLVTNQKPFQISQRIIDIIGIVTVCILIIISVLTFSLGFEEKKIQKNDFQLIQLSNSISKTLSGISIQIKQSLSKISNQIFFDKSALEMINQNVNKIYQTIGNQYIDSRLLVDLSFYQKNKLKSESSSTFNNAVSFLVSTGFLLLQNEFSPDNLTNFLINLKPILQACSKTANVSHQLAFERSRSIFYRDIIFNCIQGLIVTLIISFLIFRIFTIYSFSYSTIMIYQNSLEISQLRQFVNKCSKFTEKVKGEYKLENSWKKQKIQMIVMQLEHLAPEQPLKISYDINEKHNDKDQRDKLLQMKKLITFQEEPTRLNYIFFGLIILVIYLLVKVNMNISNFNQNFTKEKNQKRSFINLEFELASRLQIMLNQFASKSLLNQNDMKFPESLTNVENLLAQLSSTDKSINNEVNLLKTYQIITQLKSYSQRIQFFTIQQEVIACQKDLFNHSEKDIELEIEKTSPRRRGLFLVLQVCHILLVIAALWKLISEQEQIRIGCALMMEMLGESKTEGWINKDKSLVSLNASMRI